MLNELQRPTLEISLDVDIPEVPVLEHNMGRVEQFSEELCAFYNNILDDNGLDIKTIKAERTKIRKFMTTVADNRKNTIKAYKEPIKDFEETSKRIEKNLKTLDDRMKAIVDEDKALLEDPFAGLSINNTKIVLTCTKEQVDMIIDFAKKNKIEWEEIK